MPNAIKYSTTIPTGSLLKGTVALGVTTASISGPTSTTGWYYGPNPVAGKYQIIETAVSGDPDVYCPQSDAELIQFVKSKGATGANTASLSASLAWIGTQSNLMAANFEYENIVTSGLVLNLDAGFVGSYPTTASTWYDISGNASNGILTNGPTFNSANSGSIVFDGVDDYCISTFAFPQALTVITIGASIPPTWNNYAGLGSNRAPNGYIIHNNQNGTDTTYYIVNSDGNYYGLATVNPSNVQNPNFYAVSTNGSNLHKSYLNGNLIETNTTTVNRTSNPTLRDDYLGWDSSQTRPNNCKIYIHLVYDRQLTDNEVLQNFNALKGRFGL